MTALLPAAREQALGHEPAQGLDEQGPVRCRECPPEAVGETGSRKLQVERALSTIARN
jgi:hypothetical protein